MVAVTEKNDDFLTTKKQEREVVWEGRGGGGREKQRCMKSETHTCGCTHAFMSKSNKLLVL
jgi:hypothetical protein